MQRARTPFTPSALILLAAFGCGGDKPAAPQAPAEPEPAPAAPAPAPAAQPAAPAPAGPPATPDEQGVVHITGNDQMRWSATRIEVKAGQKIKIEIKNVGSLPKEVMGHNFVLLKPGSDVTAFAAKAMTAKATEYVPADAPEMIVHGKQLGPGESQLLEFDLPGPGTYPFLCSFPGHVGLMNGQLVAQ